MQGLPLIKEIEMLKETVQRKELSTSTEVEGEGEEEKNDEKGWSRCC